jgi:hypothetical protein
MVDTVLQNNCAKACLLATFLPLGLQNINTYVLLCLQPCNLIAA